MNSFNSPDNKMHPQDRRNMIIFAVLSVFIWLGFDHFLLAPHMQKMEAAREFAASRPTASAVGAPSLRPRDEVITEAERLPVRNEKMFGTLSLTGGRIDDMQLVNHYKTLEKTDHVVLLTPAGTPHAKYVETGWLPGAGADEGSLPSATTRWRVAEGSARELAANGSITLEWDNGRGLLFTRKLELDDDSLITVTQGVTNKTGAAVTLYPYSLVAQRGLPEEHYAGKSGHEGPVGYIGGKLYEYAYKKMAQNPREEYQSAHGWIGITQKYWFTGLIPAQGEDTKFRFLYNIGAYAEQEPLYQADIVGAARTIQPGASATAVQNVFTGAKQIGSLNRYERDLNVRHFDLAVDFGLLYFLTKPLFYLLEFLANHVGNFGIAIIILTFMIRIAVFPLANASFRSFAKLKKVTPEMTALREKHGNDKMALQQELVKLYEREKVNPMSGCFPILVQIPIFFALFKVFSVTIEMRHAPFYGWIHDLSQPDPTSLFNLFGLIPWDPPSFLMIGAWPCMMLFFMLVQKNLNPPPQDKTQAMILRFMPFMVTFILAKFAAGLVIYWTVSNALSVLQQFVLMKSMGVEVHLFSRSKGEKDLEKKVEEGPTVHPGLVVAEHEVEEALGDATKPVSAPKPRKKKKR